MNGDTHTHVTYSLGYGVTIRVTRQPKAIMCGMDKARLSHNPYHR